MFTILFTFTFIYIVLLFAGFVSDRLITYKAIQAVDLADLFDAVDTIMDKPIYRSVGCAAVDYSQFNCDQLRSLCTERGIKWRNVHGRNKHLKKAEMIQLLG
jgi:hypothetical protein